MWAGRAVETRAPGVGREVAKFLALQRWAHLRLGAGREGSEPGGGGVTVTALATRAAKAAGDSFFRLAATKLAWEHNTWRRSVQAVGVAVRA